MTAPRSTKAPKIEYLEDPTVSQVSQALTARVSFNSTIGLVGRASASYYKGHTFYGFSDDVDYVLYSDNEPYAWHSRTFSKWSFSERGHAFAENDHDMFLKMVMKWING
jgi:hypothetical protein